MSFCTNQIKEKFNIYHFAFMRGYRTEKFLFLRAQWGSEIASWTQEADFLKIFHRLLSDDHTITFMGWNIIFISDSISDNFSSLTSINNITYIVWESFCQPTPPVCYSESSQHEVECWVEIQAHSTRQQNSYRSPAASFLFHLLSEIWRNTASSLYR